MKIIGITGSIGTGKSTLSKLLSDEFGLPIIDADEIVREVHENEDTKEKIKKEFGANFYDNTGSLNKAKISEVVFCDEEKRKALNNIIHPLVKAEFWAKVKKYEKENKKAVLYDCPLLIEEGLYKDMDFNVLVYADEETQISRIMQRNNLSKEDAIKRISSQMKVKDKIPFADMVVYNTGSVEDLKRNLNFMYNNIIN